MDQINKAIEVLNNDGIILYPSDTVWGLGCKSNNENVIQKLYDIKKRVIKKKFILLLADDRQLNKYIKEVPEIAWDILDYSINQPTIIYPNAYNLSKLLIADDGSIAVRIAELDYLQQIIKMIETPLISTSANVSGEKTPTSLQEVSNDILSKVDFIVDLPTITDNNNPSSIIKLKLNGEIEIIRK